MSLIEKIARAIVDVYAENTAAGSIDLIICPTDKKAAQAALTAIMGEGDRVQQCDIDLVQQILLRHSHSDFDTYGEAACHRLAAAAAERARIVAWLRGQDNLGPRQPGELADSIERGEV